MLSQQSIDLEQITASNAARIQVVASIGGGSIRDVTYSPDGRWLAAGSSIGVWLYTTDLNNSPHLLGKDECGYTVVFSKDSKLLASPGQDRKIWFWELDDGYARDKFQLVLDEDVSPVRAIAFHPFTRLLAVGTWTQKVQLWDLEKKALVSEILQSDPVNSIAFSPDGSLLAIGSLEGKATIHQLTDGTNFELPRIPLPQYRDRIQVAFSAKGQFAYGSGGIVVLWDINAQKELRRFAFAAQGLEALTFSDDETMLATANWAGQQSGPGAIRVFDLTKNAEKVIASDGGVSVSFHPHDKKLAFAKGGWNSTIEVYDIETENRFHSTGHGTIASGVAVSSDSKLMAYGVSKGIIRVIDINSGTERGLLQKNIYDTQSASGGPIAFDPQGSIVFSSFDRGTQYSLWNTETNSVTPFEPDWRFTLDYLISSVCMSTEPRVLAVGSSPLFRQLGEEFLAELISKAQQTLTFDVAVTTENQIIVVHKDFQSIQELANLSSNTFLSIPNLEAASIRQGWNATYLSISRDGKLVVGAGSIGSGSLRSAVGWLWDIDAGKARFAFQSAQYYGAEMKYALFNPDERIAIYADTSGEIFIWDVNNAVQIKQFHAHQSSLWNMQLTPNGTRLITLGSDGTIRMWGVK